MSKPETTRLSPDALEFVELFGLPNAEDVAIAYACRRDLFAMGSVREWNPPHLDELRRLAGVSLPSAEGDLGRTHRLRRSGALIRLISVKENFTPFQLDGVPHDPHSRRFWPCQRALAARAGVRGALRAYAASSHGRRLATISARAWRKCGYNNRLVASTPQSRHAAIECEFTKGWRGCASQQPRAVSTLAALGFAAIAYGSGAVAQSDRARASQGSETRVRVPLAPVKRGSGGRT